MTETVELLTADCEGIAVEAAALLNLAWEPPALDYSAAYMDWQMRFPEAGPFVGIRDELGRLVAFGGATRRRAGLGGGEPFSLAVVSFIAVAPEARGRGLARKIYEAILEAIEVPVLTYALSGSTGGALIRKMYPAAGFELHSLPACSIYARMANRVRPTAEWHESSGDALLRALPDAREWEHWKADPRRHEVVALPDGGWAWIGEQITRGKHGEQRQLCLETLSCPRIGAAELEQAFVAAVSGLGELPGVEILQANNLSAFPAEVLRLGGWRQIGKPFECWWAVRAGKYVAGLPKASLLPII